MLVCPPGQDLGYLFDLRTRVVRNPFGDFDVGSTGRYPKQRHLPPFAWKMSPANPVQRISAGLQFDVAGEETPMRKNQNGSRSFLKVALLISLLTTSRYRKGELEPNAPKGGIGREGRSFTSPNKYLRPNASL